MNKDPIFIRFIVWQIYIGLFYITFIIKDPMILVLWVFIIPFKIVQFVEWAKYIRRRRVQ